MLITDRTKGLTYRGVTCEPLLSSGGRYGGGGWGKSVYRRVGYWERRKRIRIKAFCIGGGTRRKNKKLHLGYD